jgi:signal transduction histidine kinase
MEEILSNLKELFEVRNTFVKCETLNDLIEKTLEISSERLKSQTASIFLFSKVGLLERVSIKGIDKNGCNITNDWFSDEKYEIGTSFTGKVAMPKNGSDYGEPYWTNNLDREELKGESRASYLQKIGELKCAIAVPLNGQHRTYGVLEVINKLNKNGKADPFLCFSQDDVYWLSNIAINLASAISNMRRRNELSMLGDLNRILSKPFNDKLDSVCSEAVDKLVSPLTHYRACILRVASSSHHLDILAKAGDKIIWDMRLDDPILKGQRLAGKVYETGKSIIIENIEFRQDEFKNINWIKMNRLKSFICLPLLLKDKILGTLSVYTGYIHKFCQSDISFLENIVFLIASFIEKSAIIEEQYSIEKELDRERNKILSSSRKLGYDLAWQSRLHDFKHKFQRIQSELKKSQLKKEQRTRIIGRLTDEIKNEISQIQNEMESSSTASEQAININDVINEVVRYFKLELKGTEPDIKFKTNFSDDIPYIKAKEAEIREIIFNLVSNAVKAIQNSNKKDGEICIITEIIDVEIPYIQISFKDNGIGIKNEDKEKVYVKGYTTFKNGTGAGLFIARHIIGKIYGGKIDFESSVGKGTKIWVRLPKRRLEI